MAAALRRVGLSWWRDGLGGGEVAAATRYSAEEDEAARVAGMAEHFSRMVALDARPARGPQAASRRAAEFQYRGPDLTKTLPPELKARLVIFYLDPRSFAALACTCKAWHALSVGPDSLWRDKLAVLEALWPGAGLPSDEGIITYYRVGGTDRTAWMRRYAKAQAIAPKLSATACECAGAEGFRTRLFGSAAEEHGSHWDLLPGPRSGSPFPTVALCRSLDTGFEVRGAKQLQPGTYLLRWRVRSARDREGLRPPLAVTAAATTASLRVKADAAASATAAAASTAAGLAATALAISAAGLAGPIVLGAAVAASVAAGGAVAASVAHNVLGVSPDVPCLMLPAPNPLFDVVAAQAAAAALAESRVGRGARGNEVRMSAPLARQTDVMSDAARWGVEGTWRLDLEGHMTGWRYVHVAIAQVASPCIVRVSIAALGPGRVMGLAVDYAEFVPLHDDAFRLLSSAEPVDVTEPAGVEYDVARRVEASTVARAQ